MKGKLLFGVYGVVCVVVIAFLLEAVSGMLLKKMHVDNTEATPKFNRELSGYTIFKNTPNFKYSTNKEDENGKDVTTDSNGFISDEVITEQKDSGVVRVFLLGGSALLGAGQTPTSGCYKSIKPFSENLYEYRISIAGYLKQYLQQHFPGKKIQVINNACYERQLHQSMLTYLSQVNRFKPDVIVNMDGFNDLAGIASGDVYDMAEKSYLDRFSNLKSSSESFWMKFKSVRLAYYLATKWKESNSAKAISANQANTNKNIISATVAAKQNANADCFCYPDTTTYSKATYHNNYKGQFVQRAGPWLKVLDDYMAILNHDSVKFVFVLQPILARECNKPLADYEKEMAHVEILVNPKQLGANYGIRYLILKYFYDDYLTKAIQKDVEASNFTYCDMNKEIQSLDKNFEFYIDYCHLTKQANKHVAEKIGSLIIEKQLIK